MPAYTKSTTASEKTYQRNQNLDYTPYGNPARYTDVYPPGPSAGITIRTVGTSLSGSTLPDFRQRIARGTNATTVLAASETTLKCTHCESSIRGATVANSMNWSYQRKEKAWWSGGLVVPPLPNASLKTSAINSAKTAFYKNLNKQMTLVSGGTALGELAETLRMIKNPAKALRGRVDSYLSKATKLKKRKKPSLQKDLSDTYLEYAFGWSPLLGDIDDAMGYLDKRKDQLTRKFFTVIGTGKAEDTTDVYTSEGFNSQTLRSNIRTKYIAKAMYKGAVGTTVMGSGNTALKSLGLAPSDFIPTAWELLPWSFLIDYFTNIGDVISAYSTGRVGLAWGFEATHLESRAELLGITRVGLAYATTWYANTTSASGTATNKQYNRSPITYVPLPDFSFEIPGMGTKWLNMAALVSARKASSQR